MAERNSRTTFSRDELKRILSLVKELEAADRTKQKDIRAKIRKIGLYWSEVTPPRTKYTVANLLRLFDDGTLKLSDSENNDVEPSTPKSEIAQEAPKTLRHIKISPDKEISQYMAEGFDGFIRVSELRDSKFLIPDEAGVYVVLRVSQADPEFLEKGTGGFSQGKNPNVSMVELTENFVYGVKTVYIGKASTSLRKRVGQLLRFGAGSAVSHWGGRYLWQLADSDNLMIAWKPTPDCDPRTIEARMIQDFISLHGKRPFANLKN